MQHKRIALLGAVTVLALCVGRAQVAAPSSASGPVACRVEVDKPVLPADRTTRAVIKITLDAAEVPGDKRRPPVNLAIVLDRSGSMAGNKLENAKEAAIAALRRLDGQDIFSLVVYSTTVETVIPAQPVTDADALERRIRALRSGDTTNLFGGVNQGASELRKNLADKRYISRIILLSDGLANVGPSSVEELGRLGAALLKEGISVTTVGVGNDYNEDVMTQISQESDGNSYFVEASQDLPRIFAAELGDVLSVVARKVTIEITCPAGIRPIRFIGRDGRLSGQKADVFLNQLYGGQSKYALLEVEVPPTHPAESRPLATANCTYENALDNARQESQAQVGVFFSAEPKDVATQVNRSVQSDASTLYNVEVTNQAVDLTDRGKNKEAADILRQRSQQLKEDAVLYRNSALEKQSLELDQQAATIEQLGMDNTMRKTIRTLNYQAVNQQENK